MLIATKAIVLSKLKYRDHDLIVKCYTQENGTISLLVRGVLKSKRGKFKTAYFQPLSILDVIIDFKEKRSLQYFKELKIAYNFSSTQSSIIKSTIAMFLAEVLNNTVVEEEQNELLYDFLESSLVFFDESELNPNFHLSFLLEFCKYLGFYPDTSSINQPYFNMEEGKFQLSKTNDNCITGKNLTAFKELLGTKFDESKSLSINTTQKRELLSMILLYFKLHLDGFKHPKSVAVLNQVFT
ncbi:DNA repair protein RecO [Flavobacteriaceae sp. LMIT009]